MILANVLLSFAGGATDSSSTVLAPWAGPACFFVSHNATLGHGVEAWIANGSGAWSTQARVWAGWTLTSGGQHIASGRASAPFRLAGPFEPYDGVLDFDGHFEHTVVFSGGTDCATLGPTLTMATRGWAIVDAQWAYTVFPGGSASLTYVTTAEWAAEIELWEP